MLEQPTIVTPALPISSKTPPPLPAQVQAPASAPEAEEPTSSPENTEYEKAFEALMAQAEIVEQKYTSFIDKMEVLLKRVVNQFDEYGNAILQSIYDANEKYSYSLSKGYTHGLLVFEIDPIGNKTEYSYDANQNLTKITRSDTGISIEYGYGLRNLLIYTIEKDWAGNQFKTEVFYDLAGYKIAEIDRLGNETRYVNDSLGRPICITYPPSNEGFSLSYTYSYDLFDNPISVTDPKERVLSRSYNVKGKLAEINYLDGPRELFRYDSGGNLH
ncbi:MAG: hypothetical protein V4487_00155, partial [Chlamydiota bacterium]